MPPGQRMAGRHASGHQAARQQEVSDAIQADVRLSKAGFKEALIVGTTQILALFAGISRDGVAMVSGMFPYGAFETLREENPVFSTLFGYFNGRNRNLSIHGQATRASAEYDSMASPAPIGSSSRSTKLSMVKNSRGIGPGLRYPIRPRSPSLRIRYWHRARRNNSEASGRITES